MIKLSNISLAFVMLFILTACSQSADEIRHEFESAYSIDEMQVVARDVRNLGKEGMPIFLDAIIKHTPTQYILESYGKINVSLINLRIMAKDGTCDKEAVSVLFDLLENQQDMQSSLITVEILNILTGNNVGYDKEFIQSYTPNDEAKRKKLITEWRSLAGLH